MNDDQKITTEDKELADMIAGLNSGAASSAPTPPPVPAPPIPPADPVVEPKTTDFAKPIAPPVVNKPDPPVAPKPVASDGELKGIKSDVLNELKPLVDKLDIPAEEKFDTLLLLIRSTDDKSLIASAHDAAKAIPDEKRRATALLDIIKEIDFFENPS